VLTVLISGSTGFIGSRLARSLRDDGHRVIPLARPQSNPHPSSDSVRWDPEAGQIDREALRRVRADAVVNLAGASIAQRWTARRKRQIRDSRVHGTTMLAESLAQLPEKPAVLVSGSAIGFYGAHRGDELLDENSAAGNDFLARTAQEWEDATAPAAAAGIRVATPRTGVVLGRHGGALARMLPPFRLGIGGRLGSGQQWMSWIALDDAVHAIRFLIDNASVRGAANLVSPNPVRNDDFSATLARVLRRPAVFPVPASVLELIFGTMASNTILASQRAVPKRLAGAGFEFRHPRLEDALRFELRR
jgi:uncharacterized protein (TIGR01777 family)